MVTLAAPFAALAARISNPAATFACPCTAVGVARNANFYPCNVIRVAQAPVHIAQAPSYIAQGSNRIPQSTGSRAQLPNLVAQALDCIVQSLGRAAKPETDQTQIIQDRWAVLNTHPPGEPKVNPSALILEICG